MSNYLEIYEITIKKKKKNYVKILHEMVYVRFFVFSVLSMISPKNRISFVQLNAHVDVTINQ